MKHPVLVLALCTCFLTLVLFTTTAQTSPPIERVSVASGGAEANAGSYFASISSNGRYAAFESNATNLVAGDTNVVRDVFVHDRQTNQTTRVSVASDGTQSDAVSYGASISSDGRYVAFFSAAHNLVTGDTNGLFDVFVRDLQTGQIRRVSVASDGTQGNSNSSWASISGDGRYVAFESDATNLVPDDTNSTRDIFVHNLQTGQTTRVSVASDGTQGNSGSYFAFESISNDGRYLAFRSSASNLVAGDTNGYDDIFVHNLQMGQTTRVSVASDGTQSNVQSYNSSISSDGRYVAFDSSANNLVTGDTNGLSDVFVHDIQTGQTMRVSVASDGTQGNTNSNIASISSDGRYVAFESSSINLVTGDTNNSNDIFIHDIQTGQTMRVSVASDGTQGNYSSFYASISSDGHYVAFESYANNLVLGDTGILGFGDNGVDIFVATNPLSPPPMATPTPLPSASVPPIATGFQWPVDNPQSNYLSYTSPDTHCPGIHHAKDFAPPGMVHPPVYAVADGKVVVSKAETNNGNIIGYGYYIIIWHRLSETESVYSLYAHLLPGSLVEKGQMVHRGDIIAQQDTSGGANNIEHLHFELSKTQLPINRCPSDKVVADQYYYDPIEFIPGHWWQSQTHSETAASVTSAISTEIQNTQATINPNQQTNTFQVLLQGLKKLLSFAIDFPGSSLEVTVYRPNGAVYGKYLVTHPPALITIPDPTDGNWGYSIRAVEVPYSDYPYAVSVGTRNEAQVSADNDSNANILDGFTGDLTPPTTTLVLNTQSPNALYNQPVEVSFSAEDNVNGEGVALTLYSLDGGENYQTYTDPFTVSAEGTNTILFYSQDGVGNSEVAKTSNFIIDTTPPSIPDLLSPPDQAALLSNRINFQWSVSTDAVHYEIRLGHTNPPTQIVASTTTTNYVSPYPLTADNYYWQVRALDIAGNASNWSAPYGVSSLSDPNSKPSRNYFTTSTPTLTWSRVSWAVTYEIQVDNMLNFSSPLDFMASVPNDQLSTPTEPLPNGIYYWHVRACPVTGACGAWSATDSFVVNS